MSDDAIDNQPKTDYDICRHGRMIEVEEYLANCDSTNVRELQGAILNILRYIHTLTDQVVLHGEQLEVIEIIARQQQESIGLITNILKRLENTDGSTT